MLGKLRSHSGWWWSYWAHRPAFQSLLQTHCWGEAGAESLGHGAWTPSPRITLYSGQSHSNACGEVDGEDPRDEGPPNSNTIRFRDSCHLHPKSPSNLELCKWRLTLQWH